MKNMKKIILKTQTIAIVISLLTIMSCSKDKKANDRSKQGSPSGTMSITLDGKEYKCDVEYIMIPSDNDCEGLEHCQISANGMSGNYRIEFRTNRTKEGEYKCNSDLITEQAPFDLVISELNTGQSIPPRLFRGESEECNLNISQISGYQTQSRNSDNKLLQPRLDKFKASFSMKGSDGKTATGNIEMSLK